MIDPTEFSNRFTVRVLNETDIPAVYALCRENTLYYRYCPPAVTESSIRSDMKALPPRKTPEDKYYLGYFEDGRLTAVMDYIHAFPNAETDFIGFFMVNTADQKKGVGSEIIRDLCDYLAEQGIKAICLGWVHGNPQAEHFWKKNGFQETGKTSETGRYTIVYAEKKLHGVYICKTPSPEEMNRKWDTEISLHAEKGNWIVWKSEAIESAREGRSIPYYGILDGLIICEATAVPCPDFTQPGTGKAGDGTVELKAFRTMKEYRGQGYFSRLMDYLQKDLKQKGYRTAVVGVEPEETLNQQIYSHWGFTEHIGSGTETYPDGTVIHIEFFAKQL